MKTYIQNDDSLDSLIPILKSLFDHSLDNVAAYNLKAEPLYFNPTLTKTLNIGIDDLQRLAKLQTENATAPYLEALHKTISTGKPSSLIVTMQLPQLSRIVHDLVHISPLIDKSGKVVGALVVGRDLDFYQQQQHQETKKQESYLRALLDTFPFIVWMKDKDGRFLTTNQQFAEVAGVRTVKELEGKTDFEFFPAELAQGYIEDDMEVFSSGKPKQIEEQIQNQDGVVYWAETYKSPVRVDGKVIGTVGFARDISEQKKLLSEIASKEQEYTNLVQNVPLTIVRYDMNCKRIFVNKSAALNHGSPAESYIGKTPEEAWSSDIKNITGKEFQTLLTDVIRSGQSKNVEIYCEHVNSHVMNLVTVVPEYNKHNHIIGALTIANDVSEIVQYRQRLEHLAYHDPLTDLPNRTFLNEHLQKAVSQHASHQGQIALMFLDLDYFKSINDTLGHEVGDQLLVQASKRIMSCLRSDDVLARIGGDEFAMLVKNVNTDELSKLAQRISSTLTAPFEVEKTNFFVTASVGIACYPQDTNNIEGLMKYADTAMYHAKKKGRNNFQFYVPELTSVVSERLAIETYLRYALELKELTLAFQPKIDMRSGNILGAEALLRWDSLKIGKIEPNKFISIAEENGMIVEIGDWVLKQACMAAAALNKGRNTPLTIAVNLSSRQFIRNDIYSKLMDTLLSSQCHPTWIEIEITESLLLQDSEEILKTLKRIDEMGIKLAIDDFGTGYSALAYLNKFPINQVKIDRSFVHNIETDKNAALLVKAIIAMAASLDKECIAEGIETQGQVSLLQSFGCYQGQGFLLGKPMPFEQFHTLLNSR